MELNFDTTADTAIQRKNSLFSILNRSKEYAPGSPERVCIDLQQAGILNTLDMKLGDLLAQKGEGSKHVQLAAALLSAASRMGHSAIYLDRLAEDAQALFGRPGQPPVIIRPYKAPRADFETSALVSKVTAEHPAAEMPLVLDKNRLYFNRFYRYEHRIAETLKQLASESNVMDEAARQQCREQLSTFFTADEESFYQKMAGMVALHQKLTIITGGPGTGKTYTVLRLLAMLLEQNKQRNLRIAIAAPTGKAANRVRESVTDGLKKLAISDRLKQSIPLETQTLHRLLGVRYRSASFRHNREQPLPYDIVIVDEASMIDIGLMAKFLDALSPTARLILLGDRYQLASVEAGAVFADICDAEHLNRVSPSFAAVCDAAGLNVRDKAPADDKQSPLRDSIVELTHSRRFTAGSGIGRLAKAINDGDAEAAIQLLKHPPEDISWEQGEPRQYLSRWKPQLQTQYNTYRNPNIKPEDKAEAMKAFQLLSAHRKGRDGVEGLNEYIERLLKVKKRTGSPWYAGRPVIMTRNDYQQGLFNGNLGITQTHPEAPEHASAELWVGMAAFDKATQQERIQLRRPAQLQEMETCWALSVHKSQGSEYNSVLLALPQKDSPVLTRELLYTAVTRAKEHICIAGSEQLIRQAILRKTKRFSGLRPRLWT